jgi:hypothetical protein
MYSRHRLVTTILGSFLLYSIQRDTRSEVLEELSSIDQSFRLTSTSPHDKQFTI